MGLQRPQTTPVFAWGGRASVREICFFKTRAKNSSRRLNTVLVSGSEEDVVVRFGNAGPVPQFQLALFYRVWAYVVREELFRLARCG